MKRGGLFWASLPLLILLGLMTLVIRSFGADALSGGSQVALVLSAGIAIVIAMTVFRKKWDDLDQAIGKNIHNIGSAVIILILIGAIGGTWMLSGIVPTMIVYGLKIISPAIFLFAASLICAFVSIITGSSWTTIATLGVALITIGKALGYSPALCAGAIISGAYFGDKISPLSDTTVLASSMCGVPLFEHIKFMMKTTGPAMLVALMIYLAISICHGNVSAVQSEQLDAALRDTFHISPWLLVVPVLTGVLIVKKVPTILTLLCASLMAAVTALIAQPDIVAQVAGCTGGLSAKGAFCGSVIMISSATAISTGNEMVDALVQTGGMNGMLPTIFLIVSAATFGGVLVGGGMVDVMTGALTRRISSRAGLVGATILTGILSNLTAGDQYLSIILTSRVFKDLYAKLGFEPRLLSRSVEDSATITSVLIPWNSCGMTQSTVLGVPTVFYFPFCFFNLISPLMSLANAFIVQRRK